MRVCDQTRRQGFFLTPCRFFVWPCADINTFLKARGQNFPDFFDPVPELEKMRICALIDISTIVCQSLRFGDFKA